MSASFQPLNLGDLVNQIKKESRIAGSNDLDDTVLGLINELLLQYTYNNRYFELLNTNYPIATIAATQAYSLPPDFQNFKSARYKVSSGSIYPLYKRTEHLAIPVSSIPRYFELSGGQLNILPSDNIQDAESILLDYYALPPKMSDLTNDTFPIPRLYASLKQETVYRLLIYNKVETAPALKSSAKENEIRSKPSG